MTKDERMRLEQAILHQDGLTQFSVYFDQPSLSYYLWGTHETSSHRSYDLWIPIPQLYPHQRPPLYIARPVLLPTANRGTVNALGVSHAMHTLANGPNGVVQICHWRDDRWHAALTLNKVVIKGLIWLEAYEQHLATGQPITGFVRTMS